MNLPLEIIENIFSLLNPSNVACSECVCKQWKEMLCDSRLAERVWTNIATRMLGGPIKIQRKNDLPAKLNLKILLNEIKKIKTPTKKLEWAIISGYSHYAYKIWNEEIKPIPKIVVKPGTIIQLIYKAINLNRINVLDCCVVIRKELGESDISWNEILIESIKRRAPAKHIINVINKFKVDINVKVSSGETLLSVAIQNFQYDIVLFLLDHGASIFILDDYPILYFMNASNLRLLEKIMERMKAENKDLVLKDINKLYSDKNIMKTLLHLAIDRQQVADIKWLLKNGADMSIPDSRGYWPIHVAAQKNEEIFKILLDSGDDIYRVCRHYYDDSVGNMQPIHFALKSSLFSTVEEILNRTDNAARLEVGDCSPPMFYAKDFYSKLKFEVIYKLLDKGANPSVNYAGKNMFHIIAKSLILNESSYDAIHLLSRLKSAGVPADVASDENITPLLYQILGTPNIDVIKWFVEEGNANVNFIGQNSMTPFLASCKNSTSKEVILYLVRRGADVKAEDIQGITRKLKNQIISYLEYREK